jgi:hypothetical protein
LPAENPGQSVFPILGAPAVFDGPIDSPSFLAFAKLKAFLQAARQRTFDHVNALVALALDPFTATECRNYVRHCGYRVANAL